MARFFFHLEHARIVRDEVGSEHADLNAAKIHAVKALAEALAREPEAFWASDAFRLTVAEVDGLVLFTIEMFAGLSPAVASPSSPGAGRASEASKPGDASSRRSH
jgi:hypothetical protein